MGDYLIPDAGLSGLDPTAPEGVLGPDADPQLDPGVITFATMWGPMLDRELSSADRVALFTPARRQMAINDALLEFCRRTRCLDDQYGIPMAHGESEYPLETHILGYLGLTPQAVSVQIETIGQIGARYLSGPDDLPRLAIGRIDQIDPGWRNAPSGTPTCSYLRRARDGWQVGFYPPPHIPATEVWTAVIGAYVRPVPMTADDDLPFSYRRSPTEILTRESLFPWVQAVLYLAASYLEKYRKDVQRQAMFLQLYDTDVEKYVADQKPVGPRQVHVAHDHRWQARRRRGHWGQWGRWDDPRR